VIETIMVFALGFLSAALLALLVLPALSRRAERLARRRVEARLPLSMAEIAAERDHLRAEIAVEARRIELKAEAAAQARADDMAELGRRAVLIADLQADVVSRSDAIAGLDRDLGAARQSIDVLSVTLERTGAELALASEELLARRAALGALQADHGRLQETAEERRLVISTMETSIESLRARISELERTLANAQAAIAAKDDRIEELDQARGGLETQLAALAKDKSDADASLAALQAQHARAAEELATLRAEHAMAREALSAATDRVEAERLDAEAREKAKAEDLSTAVERLRAEKAAADGALERARNERRALQRELESLRKVEPSPAVSVEEEPRLPAAADPSRPERRRARLTTVGSEPAKPAASG
jgi:chromosome segregation ATPase